ncbi:hypothetical protein HNQ64_004890 [Prosthecobacter dejongeii]|uniref:Uncharacterized protein n=1 Tax=Prosthecobacter dejongeii TaxID=48465 RepID=A0A7W7YR17_9BACT|nr:hypothetical protein [Prosthecobacter dejongeii]
MSEALEGLVKMGALVIGVRLAFWLVKKVAGIFSSLG